MHRTVFQYRMNINYTIYVSECESVEIERRVWYGVCEVKRHIGAYNERNRRQPRVELSTLSNRIYGSVDVSLSLSLL